MALRQADLSANPGFHSPLLAYDASKISGGDQSPCGVVAHHDVNITSPETVVNTIPTMKPNRAHTDTIGRWLQRELDSRDWLGADLARKIGSSNGTVSNWITGARKPNPETIQRIADVLNADVDYLLTLAGHRPADPYFDPDAPEARLLPYIRAVDWDRHPEQLETIVKILEWLVEVDRGEHNR